MEKKVNIVNLNLEKDGDTCSPIWYRFENDDRVELQAIGFYKQAAQFLKDSGNGLLLFKIESQAQFAQSLAILKLNTHFIEKGSIRPVCLLGIKSKKVEKLLEKYGCQNILDINSNPKTLLTKTEIWISTLYSQINSSEQCPMTLVQRSQDVEEVNSQSSSTSSKSRVSELQMITNEESSPELVEFIKENGESQKINLETGYLGLVLTDGDIQQSCVFESFEETNMVLEVSNSYQGRVGDSLSLLVKFIYNKCKVEIELSGKVSDVENIDDGLKHETVSFAIAEVERYDYFMSLYQKRQESIHEFMELAKGI